VVWNVIFALVDPPAVTTLVLLPLMNISSMAQVVGPCGKQAPARGAKSAHTTIFIRNYRFHCWPCRKHRQHRRQGRCSRLKLLQVVCIVNWRSVTRFSIRGNVTWWGGRGCTTSTQNHFLLRHRNNAVRGEPTMMKAVFLDT
jgi:hypothetical protein